MKHTLYISDLDGTLLNKQGELSPYTVETINQFIQQGGLFTIATGRSLESARPFLEQLDLNLPVVLSNGVVIYDPLEKRYISISQLSAQQVGDIDRILEANHLLGFFYALVDDETHLLHRPLRTPLEAEYVERRSKMYPIIHAVDNPLDMITDGTAAPYFCVAYGTRENMAEVATQIDLTPNLQSTLYSDVYNENFFMDIFTKSSNKLTGMKLVKNISRAQRTVSFGDNYNDIPMIEGANESYVTSTAEAEVRAHATAVVGDNDDDVVAKFIAERHNL